ncbi:methyl-accepting chemotaxis protein [Paenibacillus thermoaerophilus]|uniref:Methyl-accepting chemotaxis protein n=1 Tax=Paenibacillus thermoaerophilus TaxID=1215385 RepID=A0ABW2UWS8_9BACL|nr:methyl-accepting chemotaxis protein [Paenibacillus thermoaerophilus]
MAGSIERLGKLSEEIGEMTAAIAAVSNRTNILALNASIEASHAGEHGKGYSVVSAEIRNLAEQSWRSTERISSLIESIQAETAAAIRAMNRGALEVDAMQTASSQLEESFHALSDSIDTVAEQLADVSAVAEQMSAGSEQVSASLQELAELSRQSAGHAREVAAASGRQSEAIRRMSQAAAELRAMSSGLREAVNRFKL